MSQITKILDSNKRPTVCVSGRREGQDLPSKRDKLKVAKKACSFLEEDWPKRLHVEQNILCIAAGVFYSFEEIKAKEFLTTQRSLPAFAR